MNMKKFRIPTTKHFFKGGRCETFKGVNCSLLMVNAEKWCTKIKKWGRCQLAIAYLLCVASLVFPTFSVFKVVYHEHPFAFSFSVISVMP